MIEAEYNLGVYYEQYRHNQEKAIEVYENILKKFEQGKVEHLSILMAINNLANIYAKRNKKVEAERLYKELEEKMIGMVSIILLFLEEERASMRKRRDFTKRQ